MWYAFWAAKHTCGRTLAEFWQSTTLRASKQLTATTPSAVCLRCCTVGSTWHMTQQSILSHHVGISWCGPLQTGEVETVMLGQSQFADTSQVCYIYSACFPPITIYDTLTSGGIHVGWFLSNRCRTNWIWMWIIAEYCRPTCLIGGISLLSNLLYKYNTF